MSKRHSLQWSLRLLRAFCPPELIEEIEGDLMQRYERELLAKGRKASDASVLRRAKWRLFWSTLRFFRPGILLRNKFIWKLKPFFMFNHYLKMFIRSSLKHASYSFINVTGLAIGLGCGIFAFLWILDEISYDQFHGDQDQIFSVQTHARHTDDVATFQYTPGPLAEGLKDLPEVEETARTAFSGKVLFAYKDNSFFEEGVYADASLFSIFTLPLNEGDKNNPLPDVSAVVISEKLARKYFGHESALGKVVRIDNKTDARVSAVMRDLPAQSSLQFQFVLPYAVYAKTDPYNQEWGAWTGGVTYVKLRPGTDIASLNKKISSQITHPKIWPRWGDNVELELFSIKDWHLRTFENGKITDGRSVYVRAFGLIALFILIIACINFMNLATARSVGRAKEIGIRKVIGAARASLTWQFMGESILISFVALTVALIVVHLSLPYFNTLTDKRIFIDYTSPVVLLGLTGITLFTGIIAGGYPAFFLSSLQAIHVLKGRLSNMTGVGVRKALVVFQFSMSVILIVSALVVYRQIEFMRTKNLGFDKENVFYLKANGKVEKSYEAFRQELLHHPQIESVSRASEEPMNIGAGLEMADDAWKGKTKQDNIAFTWLFCDRDFLSAFHFDLKEGRDFSPTFPADSNNFIITEEAARQMRLPQPVGERLKVDRTGTIIGVVKDFHSLGLDKSIQPVIISMRPERANLIFVRYERGQLTAAVTQVQSAFKKFEPDFPIEYTFLDDSFNELYKNEIQIGRLAAGFMAIALFISCLGLFGLSSFTAERRIKEIGIRKVLGATVSQLVGLLCRDFAVLVAISLFVGFPLAWWVGNKFLEQYAFRTDVDVSIFIVASIALIALAMVTVAWQSTRAAIANPVKNLRSE